MESVDELEAQAASIIRARQLRLLQYVAIGGVLVDLVVDGQAPTGEPPTLVIQLRSWFESDWHRVAAYAARECALLEAAWTQTRVRILVPGRGPAPEPLITLDRLDALLSTWSPGAEERMRGAVVATGAARPVAFCAMPFHEDFLDVYLLGIVPGLREVGLEANRLDQTHSFKGIMRRIWEGISSAKIVIADISGHNANVMYEVGLAHGLDSNTFLLRDSRTEIPFDIKDTMVLGYDRMKLHQLQKDLAVRLQEALSES